MSSPDFHEEAFDSIEDAQQLLPPTFLKQLLTSIALSLWFVFIYTGCNYLTSLRSDVGVAAFSWERFIPFVPILIIPYWSVDVFFFGAAFLTSSRAELRLFTKRIFFTVLLAGCFFLLFPLRLTFARPEVDGLLGQLFGSLEQMYNYFNLAPSLHIALRSVLWTIYIPHTKGALRLLIQIWFVLIGLSTLLCWQHHVIDVFTGQLLGLFVIHCFPEQSSAPARGVLGQNLNSDPRLALYYFLGSLCFVLLSAVLPLWGLMLNWPAVALLVVALGYAGFGPRIFRKQDGVVPEGTALLLAPFYLGLYLSFLWFTRNRPPWVEVRKGIYLGSALSASEARRLKALGVQQVLDLSAEWTESEPLRQGRYKNIPILDLTLPSEAQLEEARVTLRNWVANGPVYIHCSLGLSRSALVLLYYLVSENLVENLGVGLAQLRSARPGIALRESKLAYLTSILKIRA